MPDFFKPLFEFLKLTPRYLTAIGLVAGIILFGSDNFRETLGLAKFAQDYRFVLGILFLSSIALLLVAMGGGGIWRIQQWWRKRKAFKRITERLHCLTEDEKQILRYYIANNTRANMLRVENGVVSGLVSEGIIYQSASLGNVLEGFAHNIGDIAWDYLHVYPDLLNGTTTVCRTDKRERYGY
jgi:hypothetical protein